MAVSTAHIAHCGPSRGGGGGSNGNDSGVATPCENAFTAVQPRDAKTSTSFRSSPMGTSKASSRDRISCTSCGSAVS